MERGSEGPHLGCMGKERERAAAGGGGASWSRAGVFRGQVGS